MNKRFCPSRRLDLITAINEKQWCAWCRNWLVIASLLVWRRLYLPPAKTSESVSGSKALNNQSCMSGSPGGASLLGRWLLPRSCPRALCALFELSWRSDLRGATNTQQLAVTATELLQPLDLACGTLFQSSCAIQTSPTDCSDDSSGHFEGKRVGTPLPLLKFPWNAWERRSPC